MPPQPPAPAPATPRPARRARTAVVEEVLRPTPHLVRLVLGGPELEGFAAGAHTDHYVKLQLPPPGAGYTAPFDPERVREEQPREHWPRTRTYTVRAWDPETGRLTLDVVVHGERGVAGPWAAAARAGDALQLLGPGGGYAPDPGAARHLLVGDESVLPAIAASLPRVPAGVPVDVVAEVGGPEDEVALESPGELRVRWVHRAGEAGADDELLLRAVRDLAPPVEGLQAFVHGEARAVRALRRHLLFERGLPVEAASISGYWKHTLDEDAWQSGKAAWNAEVATDG